MDAEKSYYSNFMELKKERPELAEELAEEMCGGRWEDSPLLVLGSDRTETDGREYGGRRTEGGERPADQDAEEALEAAVRELREETGYVSDEWEHLITVPSNATIADNYAYVFRAVNCRKAADQDLDDTEFLNVIRLSPAEIETLIQQGGFQQAVHVMAWLLACRKQ